MDAAAAERLVMLVDAVARALANFEGAAVDEQHKQLALKLLSSQGGPLAHEEEKRDEFDPAACIG